MVDKSKKRKKGSISEEDVSSLLHSYSVPTVLTLLQELAHVAGEKINWDAMATNTATGISSAREYQVLWRHLAYGHALVDQFGNDSNPLDDDSDLEFELEAFPAVSREVSAEAAACVKVLMASGNQNDSHLSSNSTIDAPLTINIPNIKTLIASSVGSSISNIVQGTNISIPVSVQKQPLSSGTCGEKRPNIGMLGVDLPSRKKRRGWSTEEDTKLTAAVQKYGERNWANIARGDFKNDRKASELSQRWTSLKKKQGTSNVGTSSQLSETQLAAAHRAMSLALDMPMGETLKAACQINNSGTKPPVHSLKPSAIGMDKQFGTAGPLKPLIPTKGLSMNSSTNADSMVKAAAVAAGARIATAADASSLIEAARSPNVVHIKTGASSVVKPSTESVSNQLPSNVHFIHNGLAKTPISSKSAYIPNIVRPGESQQPQGHSMKPASLAVNPNLVSTAPVSSISPGMTNDTSSIPCIELANAAEDSLLSASPCEMKELVNKDHAHDQADIPTCPPVERTSESQSSISGEKVARQASDSGKRNLDNQRVSEEIQEKPIPDGRLENLPSSSEAGGRETTAHNSTIRTGDGGE